MQKDIYYEPRQCVHTKIDETKKRNINSKLFNRIKDNLNIFCVWFLFVFVYGSLQLTITLQQAKQHIAQSLNRTKLVFERLFPTTGVSSDSDYDQWLDQVAAHIEQQQREHASMNSNSVNHKSSKPAQMSAATITNHVNHKSNSTQSSGSLPAEQHLGNDLILENAKLQATVEQYKTIVADTVSSRNSWYIVAKRN